MICGTRPPASLRSVPPKFPTKMYSIVFFLQFLASAPFLAAATGPKPEDCAPKACGNLNVSYPFWLSGLQPGYCGHPSFQLTCNAHGRAILQRFTNQCVYVIDIYYHNNSFLVANSKWVSSPCDITQTDSNYNLTQFKVRSANSQLVFYYNCSRNPAGRGGYALSSCGKNSSVRFDANFTTLEEPPAADRCKTSREPVLGFDGATARDYMKLLAGGFLLDYGVTDCSACRSSNGQCGHNWTLHQFMCLCSDGPHLERCLHSGVRPVTRVILGTSLTAGFIFTCFIFFFLFKLHRNKSFLKLFIFHKKNQRIVGNIEDLLEKYGSVAPKRYRYSEVKQITKSFHDKLGEGGYGIVFKGHLQNGHLVAVKFLHDSIGNGEEFVNEVISIGRTSHVNIVSLLGFCLEGSKRALIYEYMPNSSLDKYIYSKNPKTALDWEKLYGISIGIARGLEYLHRGCNTRIVHFDIKPNNILLDQDFTPKIADFGLAKLCHPKDSILSTASARGTIGFIAPEVVSRCFGPVSTKADVYSYGMMVLEMVGGRRNVKECVDSISEEFFPYWIHDHLSQQGELQTCEVTSETEEIARKMTFVGLWCIQTIPKNRPSMSRVLQMLEGSIDDLEIPPKQHLTWSSSSNS